MIVAGGHCGAITSPSVGVVGPVIVHGPAQGHVVMQGRARKHVINKTT